MKNKKQTVVDWLVNEYAKAFKIPVNAVMGEIIEQAKAMEKEQTTEFATQYLKNHCFASVTGEAIADITAEEFYSNTYNK